MEKNYYVLAYYLFSPIADAKAEVATHKAFFEGRDVTGRIYISESGINGQMSGHRKDAEDYMKWMHSRSPFENIVFKIHEHHENAFPRMTVKYKRQLVALDETVDISQTAEHVSPENWNTMLEKDDNKVLLDVRNEYEWKLGRFEGAECPPCDNFREFKQFADDLKEKVDPKKTPVMMYCTGGIRCELYSALLKEKGFESIFQLDGGIINYGLKEGGEKWLGKLFVFDDRLSIPISKDETKVIASCHHCQKPAETYYNCANMDCNCLFICCSDCAQEFSGCCKVECQQAPRLRPYHHDKAHKPFRKKHEYRSLDKKTG